MEGAKRDMMLPVTHMLAFSAWLVAQSKATPSVPTSSIFLKPPGVIPLGGSTTICCSCKCDNGNFVLYKNRHHLRTLELRSSRAEFSISNATQEDTGAYSCHYLDGGTVLARSETLDVMVQEFHLPTPVLSVQPGHEVSPGAYVIFHCTIAHSSSGCFLYLQGQAMGGHYRCQCFTKGASLAWSAVSKTLDLVMRDYTWSNVVCLALGAGVLLLLGLILAEATCSHRHRPGRPGPQ
ncbi:natural cytotoxicity triggering receptor 1-like [Phoenicopterus ruber ruber]